MSWKVALFIALIAFSSADQYCRGLALGGGNDLGAFQAGAIVGLLNNLPAQETDYQIVTGLGVGALNALIVSQYNNSQNAQLEERLSDFWENADRSDFLKDWTFGRIEGTINKSGLYNSAPMNKTISKLLKESSQFARPFQVGATDLISGQLLIFNSTLSTRALQTGIYASASGYVDFPIVEYQDYLLIEGSIRYTADILGAINYCVEQGYAENNIIIDTIFTQYSDLDTVDASKYKTLDVTARVAAIYNYDNINTSLEVAINTYPSVNYRYTLQPQSRQIANQESNDYRYSKREFKTLYVQGQSDAASGVRNA
mmetsp:Transcript_5905/g.10511  ORF Transcript_5905/g.10511 Transcript_5905/m.10511 type:complete len:314 (+) Transcript_5905:200-1141(+)